MSDVRDDSTDITNACLLVCGLMFVVIGLALMKDQCLIQVPSMPQFAGRHGSPTPIDE